MATPIGTLGTIPSLSVGGVMFTDLSTLIVLFAPQNQASNTNTTARKAFAGAGYQVTSGKTYIIRATRFHSSAAAAYLLKYSDNDVGVVTATSFTNGVNMIGYSLGSDASPPANSVMESAPFAPVPATKYVGTLAVTGTGTLTTYGYES